MVLGKVTLLLFSGAASLGGAIDCGCPSIRNIKFKLPQQQAHTRLMQEQLLQVYNQYYTGGAIDDSAALVTATSGDTNTGGSSTVGAYQIQTGVDVTLFGNGWGCRVFGLEVLGTQEQPLWFSQKSYVYGNTIRLGKILFINIRNGPIFYWDASGGASQRGIFFKRFKWRSRFSNRS